MSNSVPGTLRAVGLPGGGKLVASATLKTQSAACTAVASLQMQIAPWLAAISCQFLILKLLKPLIEIVRALPGAPPSALQEFSKVAQELLPCLLAPSPAGLRPFARDLLCLEIESLNCLRHNLQSMAKLAAAEPSAVSAADVQGVLDSYQPIVGLLELGNSLFESAGIKSAQAPPLTAGTDANSLAVDQETLAGFVASLQVVVDSLGGCQ